MTQSRTLFALVFAAAMVATPVAGAVGAAPAGPAGGSPSGHASVAESTPASGPGCQYPVTMTDASGTEVTVEEPAEEVVTLGPASAQTMWELGAKEKVTGVTQFAAYLEGATERANVSGEGRTRVSVEKVVAQDPDVVLAENVTSPETVQSLRDAGLTVYYFRTAESIEDVYDKVARTGRLVGECDAAVETVREMKTEMAVVDAATEDVEKRDFLYALFGYTAGPDTFIDDGLTRAGGNNLAAGVVEFPASGYARINPETVANLSVDWIVYPGTRAAIPQNAAWNETTAVQAGNLVAVDRNRISQPAPRVVYAVRDLAKTWHPDAYAEANESVRGSAEVEVDLYDTTTATTTDGDATDGDETTAAETTTTDVSDDEGGSPGFGPVAALVAAAALVAGALARRD